MNSFESQEEFCEWCGREITDPNLPDHYQFCCYECEEEWLED